MQGVLFPCPTVTKITYINDKINNKISGSSLPSFCSPLTKNRPLSEYLYAHRLNISTASIKYYWLLVACIQSPVSDTTVDEVYWSLRCALLVGKWRTSLYSMMAFDRVIWKSNKRFEGLGGKKKVGPPVRTPPITTQVIITKMMVPLRHLPGLNCELFA